ncbi:MAG TPA: hypothetical protein VF720_03065 [Candidatus Eisenbacteria bacterium]
MERTAPTRIILTFLLALGLYGFMLPLWLSVESFWARGVAAGASRLAMPTTGQPGSVQLKPGRSIHFEYLLPDPRTGGTARVPQRLLNLPDVPLGIALSLSLLGLAWRRRVVLAAGITAILYLVHVVLLTVSAHRAAALLRQTGLDLTELNRRLSESLNGMNRYGDLSVILVVALAVVGWALLGGRRAVPAIRPEAEAEPAPAPGSE